MGENMKNKILFIFLLILSTLLSYGFCYCWTVVVYN